ncbi:MAG TPA: CoA transferase [Chloroflexota bacterium]|nr:CoA transferase [Chloroflexota bacterium]
MRLLEGYVALDLTDLRGQLCGKLLRDLGMTVIKIEPPGGDPVRRLGPFAHDRPDPEGSLRFAYLNAGKQSVVLDLREPRGRDALLGLVRQADVLVESFAPGTLDALGLDEARLREHNPHLAITSISGFGQEGPYRDYLCPDLVGLAMGGVLGIAGDPGLPPVQAPETQGAYFASLYATFATVLALWRRAARPTPPAPLPMREGGAPAQPAPAPPFLHREGGPGGLGPLHPDIAVQECLSYNESLIRTFAFDGHSVKRAGPQHPQVAPANVFPTRDGYVYMLIAEQHWQRLLDLWPGHDPALDDTALRSNAGRRARAEWITAHVNTFTERFTRHELVTFLQRHGIPALPVNTPADFMRDEQVQYRGLFQPTTHPVLGEYVQVSFPPLLDGARVPAAPPPLLGEHTRAALGGPIAASPAPHDPPAPLSGVRVLSLTTGIAGPHAARALAQSGAEVIKLESRRGGLDSFRLFSPDGDLNTSYRYVEANLSVLSAQLNLKDPEGVRLFRELAARSDVVLDNFGADVLTRLGLGPEELRAAKPDLIVVKMPGLGCSGPKERWRSWGSTLNAFTGMTYLWNHPGQERPIGYQGVYPDYVAAALVPALVYAALLYRQRTGRGVFVDLAQAESAAYMLGVSYLQVAVNGKGPEPVGNDWPYAAPHNVYPCAGEDRWCAIAVETDEQWRRLCEQLGRPELANHPRYATHAARRERLVELDALVAAWTREREPHAVMRQLQAAGVPCGAVQLGEDLCRDPQYAARGTIVAVEHPTRGRMPLADVPLCYFEEQAGHRPPLGGWSVPQRRWRRLDPPRRAPLLGEHNAYVFCDVLGYSPEQLAAWQAAGVVE